MKKISLNGLKKQRFYEISLQTLSPTEPTPACAERRFINACVTVKETLATVKPALLQRRLQGNTRFRFFPHFVCGDECCRNSVPSPYCSRNAPAKFLRCDRAFTLTIDVNYQKGCQICKIFKVDKFSNS
jgi:hypothetical protein